MSDYDAVVVGAGAVGSCVARDLADDHDVLVVEKGQVAGSAAGHAAGFVSDWWASSGTALPGVGSMVAEFFRELDGTGHFTFTERPFITFLEDEDDVGAWRLPGGDLPDRFERYTAAAVETAWPGVFDLPDVAGAVVDEAAGFVDPHTYTVTLAQGAERRGADLRTNTAVADVLAEDGSVIGVEIDGGEVVTAPTVIVAAGTHTRELVAGYVDLPTRSFVFSNARLAVEKPLDDDFPMALADGVYWRPEADGDLFVSGGEYWLEDRTRAPESVPAEFREEVARVLPRYLEAVDGMEYMPESEHTCPEGVAVAPDLTPIVDAPDRPEGLVVVDGVFGGIAMSPAYAAAVRSLVTDAVPPFPLEPLRADRFESTSTDFDLDHIERLPRASGRPRRGHND